MSEAQETTEVVEEVNQEPTVEDIARDHGWRPKDEWDGDPDLWVNAAQFNERGELYDRIKSQNKQLQRQERSLAQMREEFKGFQEHARKVAKAEMQEQLTKLKDVKKQALEDQDHDTVVEVDEKIADIKAAEKQAEQAGQETSQQESYDPEIASWLEDNQWYRDDAVMRGAADAMADQVKAEHPGLGPRELLDEVGQRVQERFNVVTDTPKRRGNNVNPIPSTRTNRKPTKRGPGKADLNDEQRKVGERYVKMGAVKSLDDYASQLAQIGALE